jgi:rRNA-processing protein FCF1
LQLKRLIIIDANFILVPIQFKIDYIDQIDAYLNGDCRFIIFRQILNELEAKKRRLKASNKSAKFETQLKAGIKYLKTRSKEYKISIRENTKEESETTDQFILRKLKELKEENKYVYLATNDYELRKIARTICPIFVLRQQKRISLIQ